MESNVVDRIAALTIGAKVPVASADAVRLAEARLGFAIPELLKNLYLNVANGGFGPGYGVIGVAGGHRSSLGTLVETFDEIVRGAEYLKLKWNTRLLAFCDWGCNIYSCVDCSEPGNPIFRSDECRVSPAGYGLNEFFEKWLDGRDLFDDDNPRRRTVEIINPFTGKKIQVKGS